MQTKTPALNRALAHRAIDYQPPAAAEAAE